MNNGKAKRRFLNIFWAVSGGAFTSLCMIQGSYYELVLSALLSMVLCGYYMPKLSGEVLKRLVQMRWYSKVLCILTSVTIACYNINLCYQSQNIYYLLDKVGMERVYKVLFIFISVLCIPMFFIFVLYGLSIIEISVRKVFTDYKKFFLFAGLISVVVIVIYLFFTNIFFAGYNVIYSMDSSRYIETNVYINFTAGENDIRQPFFGIASSLVFALPNLINSFIPGVYPYLIGLVDVFLIITGIVFLIDMMELKDNREFAFIFYIVLYPIIVFLFSIEQYAVPFFFIMLFLHQIYFGKRDEFLYALNAGTLIISGTWLPIMGIFKKMCQSMFTVIGVAIVFGRFSLFIHSISAVKELLRFSGAGIGASIAEQLKQYFNFIANCFIKTGTAITKVEGTERYVLSGEGYYWIIGIVLFLFCIISFVINRQKYVCRISMYWLIIGFIVMAMIGWGTAENNLVLYTLYFGWPFAVLIFELINNKWKISAVRVCAITGIICIGCINIWGLADIIQFGITCGY